MMTLAEALALATQHHQAGQLAEAEQVYQAILQAQPANPGVLYRLGVLVHQKGRTAQAVEYFRQAVALEPQQAILHANLGLAYQALGRLEEAAASLRDAVRLRPDFVEGHYNLGTVLQSLARPGEADACYREAVRLRPYYAEAHNNLGTLLESQGRPAEAEASYREALRLKPDYIEANNNLGNVLQQQGQFAAAEAAYRETLRLRPGLAEVRTNLGNVLDKQGRTAEAEANYREALRLRPDFPQGYTNLGAALQKQGRLDEAEACYREAIRLQPGLPIAHNNLGNVLQTQWRLDDAETCYRAALRLRPDYVEAHTNLSNALQKQGRPHEALSALQDALRLSLTAELRIAAASCLPVVYQSMADLHWWRNRLTQQLGELREDHVVLDLTEHSAADLFYLAYQGLDDRELQREAARLFKAPDQSRQPVAPPRGARKLRIGFLSSFFRTHTIGHLMRGLVAQLSRNDFDVTVFSAGTPKQDEISAFFRRHSDKFVELPHRLPAARQLIDDQHMDVLFYTDVGMDPFTATLAYSRLAPLQCVTWGHPDTTGIDTLDYFISSEALETEDAQQYYTEKLVQLKNLPIYYYKPELTAPPKDRAQFGFTTEDHLYACPQSPFKFHPDFDELLSGILRGDPQGKLVLLEGRHPHWGEMLRQRFASTMPDVLDRIRFLPAIDRGDFLNLLAISGVLLDPIHFGGGNTSYEGLAVGTPIVTLPSRFLRGRITFALFQQMQVLDCVAGSPEEYVSLALRLGSDAEYRALVRQKILSAHEFLYENRDGVRELEQWIQEAVKLAG